MIVDKLQDCAKEILCNSEHALAISCRLISMAVNGGKERMMDVDVTDGVLKDSIFFCGSVS